MIRRTLLGLLLLLTGLSAQGANATAPHLLQDAIDRWLGERDQWAFTQRAIEHEKTGLYDRLERFDPSRSGRARWELIAVNGREPTPEQRRRWAEKKFRRNPRRIDVGISDFFDLSRAEVVAETPQAIRYEVPLRREKSWLFPVDKVGVRVTVNKQTHALEHLSAHVREPFKVLLGIARVNEGEVDLDFAPFGDTNPQLTQPLGAARVSVFRFGERVDFTWTDFRRVTPYRPRTAWRDWPGAPSILPAE